MSYYKLLGCAVLAGLCALVLIVGALGAIVAKLVWPL